MAAEKPSPTDVLEIYKIYRDYIKHEDSNVNFRLTWFLAAQVFLFSAYGYYFVERVKPHLAKEHTIDLAAVPGYLKPLAPLSLNIDVIFIAILCVVGFVSARISFRSVLAADRAIQSLRRGWETKVLGQEGADHETLPGLTYGGPLPPKNLGGYLPLFLPRMAMYFWVAILIVHLAFIR